MEVSISSDDTRHTLHTHFQSLKSTVRSSTSGSTSSAIAGRRRLISFLQVQKPKSIHVPESKRLFGLGATTSKHFVLCLTAQDFNTSGGAQIELHFVQLLSNLSVDVHYSWNLNQLDTIEHSGIGPEKPKGAFALFFSGGLTSCQWIVEAKVSATAMLEFLWTICAVMVQNQSKFPRLVRLDAKDLHETALRQNLQKIYELEIDLANHISILTKSKDSDDDQCVLEEERKEKKTVEATSGTDVSGLRLGSPESNEALELLNDINWSEVQLVKVEDDLSKMLKTLEDENMAFLLSLNGDLSITKSGTDTIKTNSVDIIINAIDQVQDRILSLQDWTNESGESLGHISSDMQHFETLNNQLEMHFKNSVELERVLAKLMAQVELSKEHMLILTSLVNVFPIQTSGTSTGITNDKGSDESLKVSATERTRATIAAVAALEHAIKSTREFPACEMVALRSRGVELSKVATDFGEKLCISFDSFLQQTIKQMINTRGVRGRNGRDPLSGHLSSDEMNWSFTTDSIHFVLVDYQSLFEHVGSLDSRILATLRQIYSKQLAIVFNAHVQCLFRFLKDKLPRNTKQHFHKPTSMQSMASSISSSFFSTGDTMCAAPLMQQALDHLTPLVLNERQFVSLLFFSSCDKLNSANGKYELDDLTLMMENVFEKLLKRMIEFGEAVGGRNVLDALSLVVLLSGKLEVYRQQSAFLYNVMVSFQLQMKRIVIKFIEDQEVWINAQTVDSKMAGVLGPTKKIVNVIARLEDSVAGKSSDSTLLSIYHMIVPSIMHWIDKMADTRPKYAPLTRLENFHFLSENLRSINSTKGLPLAQYAAEAYDKYVDNLHHYVISVWDYAFKQLVPLIASIESLMTTVPASEIQYHISRQEVRRVLDATPTTFEKSVRVMHDRIKKHIRENPKLLPSVWKQLVIYGGGRLSLYALVAGDCYQLRFEPPLERGLEVLNNFAFN
ncbi:Exocyst protein Sec3 [Plasmopara halstedii]|uniref:Exocyst protein Sec3 n=1 Tax=Plasmopara halstedii TaxID=4781 RepID=A0A0P1AKJ9_PLAHL|nr:Exocyst protein Sec3 [Plasmopara halstedii]CEG41805.1 Exocyst protein Sec3 [Plasmopara halstedii]|eukprot:XP_024578174.1 Exocyst protein Sec3 [Plasmopara halstedii]